MERRRLAGMKPALLFHNFKLVKFDQFKIRIVQRPGCDVQRVQGAGLKSGATVPVVMVPLVFSC